MAVRGSVANVDPETRCVNSEAPVQGDINGWLKGTLLWHPSHER
jgi:hypothetical protein